MAGKDSHDALFRRIAETIKSGTEADAVGRLTALLDTLVDPRDIGWTCVAQAELLARRELRAAVPVVSSATYVDPSERAPTPKPTIDPRELAVRKANRALVLGEEHGDVDLRVAALRARIIAARLLPSREQLVRDTATALIQLLEHQPMDTRIERARLWRDIGRLPWFHYTERRRGSLDENREHLGSLRHSIDLALEIGDDAIDELVTAVLELIGVLVWCGAVAELEKTIASIRPRLTEPGRAALTAAVPADGPQATRHALRKMVRPT